MGFIQNILLIVINAVSFMKALLLFITLTSNVGLLVAKTHDVIVSSNVFTPNSLQIEAGDTVRWTNTGGGHNVRASDGSFRCAEGCDAEGGNGNPSSTLWSFEVTFRTLGTTAYICEPHIDFGMQGSVTVVEPTTVAVHEVHATTNNGFEPSDLSIQRGDVVHFINDGGEHNINSSDDSLICSEGCLGDGTNTDNEPTGFGWDVYVRFNQIEEIPYFCAAHEISGTPGIIHVITDTLFASGFE